MRSRRPLLSLLLATVLLASQSLAAAHEPDHALQPDAAHVCAACVYAHGAGAGAPALPALVLPGAAVAPGTPAVGAQLAAILRHHPIRGPPALLA